MLLPLYGQVPSASVLSLLNLMVDLNEYYDVNFISQLDLYVPLARSRMFSEAIAYMDTGNELDAAFFLDQDHRYEPNDFINLVERFCESDYDCLSALYFHKDLTQRVVAYKLGKTFECYDSIKQNTGIVDVDAVGLGFCCMKPNFLKKMFKEYGSWAFNTYVKDNKFIGEDIAFFKKAKKIGAKVGIYTDVKIGHVGAAV